MSTVGLSFGNPTSGQGFNVTSTVSQIVANLQGVETPWSSQLSSLESQDTALSSLGKLLSTLSNDLTNLTDFAGVLAEKTGSSSDTNIVELTSASTTASAGTHTITVNSLAQTSSGYLTEISDASDTLSGSITIQVGSGTAQTVTLDSTDNTLSGLSAAINAADLGVTAAVITDSSGSRLSITSGTSGDPGNLTISSSIVDTTNNNTALSYIPLISSSTASGGTLDGSLTVDGLSTTVTSNTVTDLIPGVTFQLLSSDSSTQVQVEIGNNNSDIESAVGQFVSDYNAVVSAINVQEGNDSSGNPEPLYGTPTLALLQQEFLDGITNTNSQGDISNIEQLGISVNSDGTLSFDSTTLDSVLNTDYSGVVSFFQNNGSWGSSFNTVLDDTANSSGEITISGVSSDTTELISGAILIAINQNSAVESTLQQEISNENSLISEQQSSLTTELNSANEVLQSLPTQLSEISEIYSSITGYNSTQS